MPNMLASRSQWIVDQLFVINGLEENSDDIDNSTLSINSNSTHGQPVLRCGTVALSNCLTDFREILERKMGSVKSNGGDRILTCRVMLGATFFTRIPRVCSGG
ncbi:unnamed protein product, partial [Choristocarpus tenellus]